MPLRRALRQPPQTDTVGDTHQQPRQHRYEPLRIHLHPGGVTEVLYEWNVSTTKPWMNLLAPVARPAFEWNHDWVMSHGGTGIAKLLGCKLLAGT